MTPQESREIFIESILPGNKASQLKEQGLYQKYIDGQISVEKIYAELKDQGI
jgi:hypothetical protein